MLHFKKILVPFDGSDHAKKALTQAIDLVQNSEDAELCILAINEDVTAVAVNNLERVYINPQPTLSKYDPANDYIAMAKKMIPEGIKTNYVVKTGDAGILIEDMANHEHFDLVIMGSRGLGIFTGLLLGSVSNYTLSHVECPVFIIK